MFVAPTWDRYSSFAQIWLAAHEKIQNFYYVEQSNARPHKTTFENMSDCFLFWSKSVKTLYVYSIVCFVDNSRIFNYFICLWEYL
jgi:pantothenate kinase